MLWQPEDLTYDFVPVSTIRYKYVNKNNITFKGEFSCTCVQMDNRRLPRFEEPSYLRIWPVIIDMAVLVDVSFLMMSVKIMKITKTL